MHASALFSTPADPATIPPQWLVKRREPLRAPPHPSMTGARGTGTRIGRTRSRSLESATAAKPVVLPRRVAGTSGTAPTTTPPTAPVRLAGSTQAGVKATGVLPVVPSAFCVPNARLAVEIDGTYRVDGDKATILLGKKLDLKAVWYAGLNNPVSPVDVHWTLQDTSTSWQKEHQNAANGGLVESVAASEKGVLFPDDVLLLFDEVDPDQTAPAAPDRKVWPIHTGTVVLKLHADATPGGGPADLSVTLTVSYAQSQLGTAHNDLDAFINPWANAFGFPPQYIKGLIQQESNFNQYQYRYEPLAWDFGSTLGSGVLFDVRSEPYDTDYRFAEPAGIPLLTSPPAPQGPTLTQTDIDGRLHASHSYWITSGKYAPCQQVVTGMGGISTWQLLLGSNGPTPCYEAFWNWEPSQDMYKWDQNRTDNQQGTAQYSTFWFFEHPTAVAQMFLAASYGLTQVGYAAALHDMGWWSAQPDRRHWANVVDPNTNIYLGARWLAWPAGGPAAGSVAKASRIASHHETSFTELLKQLLCTYNAGGGALGLKPAGCNEYDSNISTFATSFVPTRGE